MSFAEGMKQGERLNLGISSTLGMSQEEHPYTRVNMTPTKEEQCSWPLAQGCPENSLPQYSPPYFGIDPTQSQHIPCRQISVLGVDDPQKSPSPAFHSSFGPINLQLPFKLFVPHQNCLDIISDGENIQNEVQDVRDVTGSLSDNVNFASRQVVQTGSQFRGDINRRQLIANKDPVSEQASRRDEQKEANKDIQSGGGYEELLGIRIMADTGHSHDEVKLNGTEKLGVTSQFVINDQSEGSPEIKSEDINEDTENIIEGRCDAHFGLYRLSQRSQEQPQELHGYGDKSVLETSDKFPTTFPTNKSRCDQIIIMPAEEMEHHIGEQIRTGAFGTVYKAMMPNEKKCMFAIKKIKVTDKLFQRAHDKEIHDGRILHPFINPIIARAERPPNKLDQRIIYLMYPYMENRDVRCNIDSVNDGKILCPNESNTNIWIRCMYQIVQAVDFLHKPVALVRGPIFHRDLTSRNIFLDENFNVRIGEFGITVEDKWNTTHATLTKALGTEGYHPPNMNPYEYNASYDVFSVGVVILEILTGQEASFEEDPHYLYKKYNYKGGYEDLIEDLDVKAEENEAAIWNNILHRNKFAELALQAVELDEDKRKAINLLQKLEEIRLKSSECYRKPVNLGRCVSCCVNPIAKLSTKGQNCISVERNNPCRYFCIHCLMNHHFNPLVCPQHGRTRPPFGDYVYGVFVAGNDVDETKQFPVRQDPNEPTKIEQMFTRDVEKVVQILMAKHQFCLGAR